MRGPNIKWMAQLISSYHWDKKQLGPVPAKARLGELFDGNQVERSGRRERCGGGVGCKHNWTEKAVGKLSHKVVQLIGGSVKSDGPQNHILYLHRPLHAAFVIRTILRMVSYPHRPKSGYTTCYLNRTFMC